MNNIEQIEYSIIFIVIFLQVCIFLYTLLKIIIFGSIVPAHSNLNITTLSIPYSDLNKADPVTILEDISKYRLSKITIKDNVKIEIRIIEAIVKIKKIFNRILFQINSYFLRNRNSIPDFNIIKDIVERNILIIEEEINLTITIPLYLGLVGTMIGILFGLFNLSDLSSTFSGKFADEQIGKGISMLLGGVKIAMIASFSGLLLTIINSGLAFKISKKRTEERKNQFYAYIQTELLPVVNENITDTFGLLQRNLIKFNEEFSTNIGKLSGIFDENYETLKVQQDIINSIKIIDISHIAKYNVDVLNELNNSMLEFKKFNKYISLLNALLGDMNILSGRFSDFINRTDDFNKLTFNIDDNLTKSKELFEFLANHFKVLEERRHSFEGVLIDIDNTMSVSLEQLKDHTLAKIKEIRDISIKQDDLLSNAFNERKDALGKLMYLEEMSKNIKESSIVTKGQSLMIFDLVNNLNDKIGLLIQIISSLSSFENKTDKKSFLKKFNKWLRSKNNS